ncbi:MAG: T9SS type A sorting domain-containing protein [Candidatus Kapabacteria bacterium]|nr:T9SS type A sorting domain-containing protein [Candidatus Kapabacteria bacterium]
MKYLVLIFILSFALSNSNLNARQFRVSQIPNGNKFDCNTCHTMGGGTALNPFGIDVLNAFLTPKNALGNVNWVADLASIDSDNDGFTNGQELLDPNGEWKIGDPNPGNTLDVFNPGSSNSKPVSVHDNVFNRKNQVISNLSVVPNPVIFSSNIEFELNQAGEIHIELFTASGAHVSKVYTGWKSEGKYLLDFKAVDSQNNKLAKGVYLLNIRLGNASVIHKLIIE